MVEPYRADTWDCVPVAALYVAGSAIRFFANRHRYHRASQSSWALQRRIVT